MGTNRFSQVLARGGLCLVLAGALGLPVTGAQAQEQTGGETTSVSLDGVENPGHLFGQFDFLSITGIAGELGFRVSLVAAADGSPFYVLSDERQTQIILRPMVCEGSGFETKCNALLMSVVLSGFSNANISRTNAFNDAQFFARTHMISDDQAVLSRFLIGEFGVVKGNLAIEIYSFRSAAYNFARFLSNQQVSAKPGAPGLGGGSLGVLSGQEAVSPNAVPSAAMPGLDLGSEDGAGLGSLIEVLKATHMLEIVTNDVTEMNGTN